MEVSSIDSGMRERRAIQFGLISVLLWSSVATGFKLGLSVLSITQLLWLGTLISWILFSLAIIITGRWRLSKDDYALAAILGLINPCLYYLILFSAYDRLPAYIAQPLNYTWAITLALLSIPILRQSLSLQAFAGILISYAGVVLLLATSQELADGRLDALGIALALVSTLLWATYWLLNTRARSGPLALMFWSFSAALPVLTLIMHLTDGPPAWHAEQLLYGAWVGLLEMGVTFLTWQQALRLTQNTARIGQLIFLSPFLSLVLIYFILNEPIGPGALVALIIIVTGLIVTQRSATPTARLR